MKKLAILFIPVMVALASCDKIQSKMYNDYFENDFTISDIDMKGSVVSYVAHYPQDTDGYSFSVLVSEDPTPTYGNSKLYSCTTSDGTNYTAVVTGLWGGKKYYCRPCVWQGIYTYGPIKTFQTADWVEKVGTIGQCVDLGLSVLWADHNIGASNPSEIGGFYAWAETSEKNEDYSWENYKYAYGDIIDSSRPGGGYRLLSKYCDDGGYGNVDNILSLEPNDDVATDKWGDGWSTPTYLQWRELIENCSYEVISSNGRKIYKITSRLNGNSIILPGGGILFNNDYSYIEEGFYWSSDMRKYYTLSSHITCIGQSGFDQGGLDRCNGAQVRPVHSK